MTSILVTGATGTTGSRTAAELRAAGHPVRAATRNGDPRFDWYDPATHDAALAGVDRVYLVPPPGETDPARIMLPFLDRARAAGVRRAVLLSSSAIPLGGPAVGEVHAALPGLFAEWAVLRPSWFMQNFLRDHAHARSIRATGTVASATGTGRVAFIDADDIAAVAAHALTAAEAPNTDLILTGPQALAFDDIAATLTEVTGRPVTHQHLTHHQLSGRLAAGMPAEFATLLASLDLAIAEGAEDRITPTVHHLTGRPPTDFRTVAVRELAHGDG
ncbi:MULTISPECIES: NAD-dependent epimerase/dehydratase family protein [unclassified Streptomyces]|uniref:NAD-dependent epimerase/dehydratase family protein n=1 Tax=unclassified Streptomyces TaxID=2593676 RepID=UPI001908C41F|nr:MULTISPECIES: NAD-dependent epimerase/dehydratase family protein [unclassified Streptomyces]MCU4745252.1 NAD(P)H-binding protein [Streptomyces sp. G-5]QQN79808.1 NAD(P)H-binding protein [Streptomyces sp. XC 2026]